MDARRVLSLRFNQDGDCFTCCTEKACRIFNVSPLQELLNLDVETYGSFVICEMLHRSQLLALVPGGKNGKYQDNRVLIFDNSRGQVIEDIVLGSSVTAVRLRRDRIIVATCTKVHVFVFPEISLICTLETTHNPKGLCEVTPRVPAERHALVYLGQAVGSIRVLDLVNTTKNTLSSPLAISAHQNNVACIAMNQQGTMVATASVKGTLIRVWDTITGVQIVELRRGCDQAHITCLNFRNDSKFLCCSSDKGTVHIFACGDMKLNRRSAFSIIGSLTGYTNSQWGLAKFTIPSDIACICSFIESTRCVIAICKDGSFHRYVFSESGRCTGEEKEDFLNILLDEDW